MRFVVALVALAVIAVVGFVALDPGMRKLRADEAQYNEQRLQLQLERDRRRAEQLEPVRLAVDGILAAWPVYVLAAGGYAVITMARSYRSVVMFGDAPIARRILERNPELTMQTVAARNQGYMIAAAHQPVPERLTLTHAPRITGTAQDAPQLDASIVLPHAPTWAQALASGWRPSASTMLLGYTTSGPVFGSIDDLLSTAVAGRPGTGKTTLQRFIVAQAYAARTRLASADPHGALLDVAPRQMVDVRAEDGAEFARAATEVCEEIDVRLGAYKRGARQFDPYLLLVDELPIIAEQYPTMIDALRRVILEGRKVCAYAVISGQGMPAALFKGSMARDAMATRFIFDCEPQQAQIAGLDAKTVQILLGALQQGRIGNAILDRSSAPPMLVAIPNTTGADLERLVQDVTPTRAAVLPAANIPLIQAPVSTVNETFRDARDVSGDAQNSPKNDVLESVSDVSGVSPEQKRDILTLGKAGVSRRQISMQVFGSKGAPYAKVKAILDEAGL